MATDINSAVLALGEHRAQVRRELDTTNKALADLAREHIGNGMTWAEFARLAGVPQSTIKRWLDGTSSG